MSRRLAAASLLAAALAAAPLLAARAGAQTVASPIVDPAGAAGAGRPIPGPVFETPAFSRAVLRGTRTRTGAPGPAYWVQHARYTIHATLDVATKRLAGRETVIYLNRSPDTLPRLAVYLRQNVFAPGVPRRQPVPITGGVALGRIAVNGTVIAPAPRGNPAMPITAPPRRPPRPGEYAVDGTVMWISLPAPLAPGDSLRLDAAWSYAPAPSPADGRDGREDGDLFFMGYWYPQIAVYDDVNGWVTDPYQLEAEFYMDPADYDVRVTVPHGWVVGATGTLENAAAVLSRAALDSLAAARATGRVVRILTPGPGAARAFAPGGRAATWHFVAKELRDFAWGTSDRYAWDATRALVNPAWGDTTGAAAASESDTALGPTPDTVDISSFFRLTPRAAAWAAGGARYTRDAIQQLSAWLWAYPWPKMTSMEGVLTSGGMEYPMMTLMQPWADTLSLAGDLMHETGHMWFPMQVGSNETRFPWMDEGFTQFDVAVTMRRQYGPHRAGGRANDSEAGQRATYLAAVRAGRDAPLMTAGTGDDYPQASYFSMYYDKTAVALDALARIIGPATLHRAFVTYGRRWVNRHPQPWDFFNTVSSLADRNLSWFWNTWFFEAWPLDQALASVVPEADSTAVTVVDRGLAPMPILLAVTRADGSVQRVARPVTAWLTGGPGGGSTRTVVVRVASPPPVVKVQLDPDGAFPSLATGAQTWTAAAGLASPVSGGR